jgi:hypothetical protein
MLFEPSLAAYVEILKSYHCFHTRFHSSTTPSATSVSSSTVLTAASDAAAIVSFYSNH